VQTLGKIRSFLVGWQIHAALLHAQFDAERGITIRSKQQIADPWM
jgi:hypothetical protein